MSSALEQQTDDKQDSLREVAENLSKQPEKLDRDFWKEYFYWSWRCLLFVLFIVVATNFSFREGIVDSFDHISATKWTVLVIAPLLFGPLVFIGWSYLWMWGQDLLGRHDQS